MYEMIQRLFFYPNIFQPQNKTFTRNRKINTKLL